MSLQGSAFILALAIFLIGTPFLAKQADTGRQIPAYAMATNF